MVSFVSPNRKLALIIGINDYPGDSKLNYCINDANDVGDQLKLIKFHVTQGINCNKNKFNDLINEFVTDIQSGDLVLFYFAGHGNQFEGQSYLLPASYYHDHSTNEEKYIEENSINVQYILDKMAARHPYATVYILDCCRIYVKTRAVNSQQGLTGMKGPPESFIAFSCGFNQGALDETQNNRNSIFTEYLLKYLTMSTQNMNSILELVTKDMKSAGFLLPWCTTCLSKNIYLAAEYFGEQIKSKYNTWKQHGIVSAGRNGQGDQLNQLCYPQGIFIDHDNTVFIADSWNSRIIEWKCHLNNGQIIAGENGSGNKNDQLSCPLDVIVDKQNNSLIISDFGNRRVMRWFRQNQTKQQILISDIKCGGLSMDKNGFIYVSDWEKNEVRQWKEGDKTGTIVAGGNGEGNHLNQLNHPTFIFVDDDDSVYVSDSENYRVMKWRKDAKEGIVVAGGNNQGNSLKQLADSRGVIVDHLDQIYVADSANHRVMRWCEGDAEGSIVVGGNGQGNETNQLDGPSGLSFDDEENLYVADCGNNRIMKYEKCFD